MKPGYAGKKSKKSKQKKGKKKGGKGQDGDEAMADVVQPGTPVNAKDKQGPTAKDKQRQRMELKKALKVTVAGLKSKRNKLTKLASNKKPAEKKIISKQIQGLLQEQILGKTGGSSHGKPAGKPAAANEQAMAE